MGNLTVGGTGKTPLDLWLAHELTELGLAVGIVSRGYGGSNGRRPRMVGGGAHWTEVGDEPLLLARRSGCPTVVASDRLAAARALGASVDVILADDGLQHLRLARDCEIVVIDGTRGFGNGWLLPAGPLREPLRRLARVDVLVINGEARHRSLQRLPQEAFIMSVSPHAVRRVDARAPPRPLEDFRGQTVHAVAGTGNPARFFAELRAYGLQTVEHPFPDHHPLTVADLAFDDGLPVLMTEKDAVKCAQPRRSAALVRAGRGASLPTRKRARFSSACSARSASRPLEVNDGHAPVGDSRVPGLQGCRCSSGATHRCWCAASTGSPTRSATRYR